jgi:alkyl hydroperoxide reductase subunit AhpC
MSPVLEQTVVMSHGVFLVDVDKRIRSCMKYGLTTGKKKFNDACVDTSND